MATNADSCRETGLEEMLWEGLHAIEFVEGAGAHAGPLHARAGFSVLGDLEAVDLGRVDAAVRYTLAELFRLNGSVDHRLLGLCAFGGGGGCF